MQRTVHSLRERIGGTGHVLLWSARPALKTARSAAKPKILLLLAAVTLGAPTAHAEEPLAGPPPAASGPADAQHPDAKLPEGHATANDAPAPEPPDYRMSDFRSAVPATLHGAKVLTADEAADLWNGKTGAIFVDVYPQAPKPANLPPGTFWRDPVHRSIEGAHWLPNIGYGALSPAIEEYFRTRLETLTGGKKDAPLVFFCLKNCWMSWNAAKRAIEAHYTNVMWFRDGTDGWQELGYPLVDVPKVP
jgi:PQQ-dependent catabolism-associated CXXCW motif protein